MRLMVLLCSLALMARAQISDSFLQRVSEIESKSRDAAIGDDGRSRGRYQQSKASWNDVTKRRRKYGLATVTWYKGAHDRTWAKIYAVEHFRWLSWGLEVNGFPVTEQNLYACWNVGFARFKAARGRLEKLPQRTQEVCASFSGQPILVMQ